MSATFQKENVSKLSNLLLNKQTTLENTSLKESIASLFVALVQEDIDVFDLFGVPLKNEITNDTSIANVFLKKSKI